MPASSRLGAASRTVTIYADGGRRDRPGGILAHVDGSDRHTRTWASFINSPIPPEQPNCMYWQVVDANTGLVQVVIWVTKHLRTRPGQYVELLVDYRRDEGRGHHMDAE